MYFSINKSLALALDYSANCGFEYDLLIAARPDVLLGEPLSFSSNKNSEETRLPEALAPHPSVPQSFHSKEFKETILHRALAPHNEALHSYIVNEKKD